MTNGYLPKQQEQTSVTETSVFTARYDLKR
jgi:hypothetical protein